MRGFSRRTVITTFLVALAGLSACSLFVSTSGLDTPPSGPDGSPAADGQGPAGDTGPSGGEGGPPSDTGASPDSEASSRPSSKYRDLILSDAPIAYWRMGIASGSIVPDETSRHDDIVLQGSGIVRGAPGAIAGDPDTSLRLTVPWASWGTAQDSRPFDFPNGAPFTIEFWAKFDALDGGDLGLGLLNSGSQADTGYGTFVHGGGWSGFAMNFGQDASPASQNVQGPPYSTTTFNYVVITFNAGTLTYYMDATQRAQTTITGTLRSRTSDFQVPQGYSGSVDEVAIYDHALTLTQIAHHHDVGTTP